LEPKKSKVLKSEIRRDLEELSNSLFEDVLKYEPATSRADGRGEESAQRVLRTGK
jgi:hypothetical protein